MFLKMIKLNNTHWNLKSMMLEQAIHLKPTLSDLYSTLSITKCYKIGKWRLNDIEWVILIDLMPLLKV